MPNSSEDRYAKYDNFAGPDPKEEHAALARWNAEKGYIHNVATASAPKTWIGTPRRAKHGRSLRV